MMRSFLKSITVAVVLLGVGDAYAFQILSPKSDACHENIMLGVLDRGLSEYSGSDDPSLEPLLAELVSRVRSVGAPDDPATRGFVAEMVKRYGWSGSAYEEQYVLASFVAGVRGPDTNGFSIVDLNEVRQVHIRDEDQSAHFLRRSTVDGKEHETESIQEARARLLTLARKVHGDWRAGSVFRAENWNFAFYGKKEVMMLAPAFDLGLVSHLIQDSYSHAIRDENFNILAISNYVDLINENLNEERDGPAHSDRLDACNPRWDSFDAMRIGEARRQNAKLLDAIRGELGQVNFDEAPLNSVLDVTFAYRSGCNLANSYCESEWYRISQQDVTKPFSIAVCGSIGGLGSGPRTGHRAAAGAVAFLILGVISLWIKLRFPLGGNAAVFRN